MTSDLEAKNSEIQFLRFLRWLISLINRITYPFTGFLKPKIWLNTARLKKITTVVSQEFLCCLLEFMTKTSNLTKPSQSISQLHPNLMGTKLYSQERKCLKTLRIQSTIEAANSSTQWIVVSLNLQSKNLSKSPQASKSKNSSDNKVKI
jgi:hypothetical protein